MIRPLWFIAGIAALLCGIAGIALPLVPTTPFLLLAAFCFARSSPRLEAWLLSHPTFGPMIWNWRRHRSIDRRAKRAAIGLMIAALALSVVMQLPLWVLAAQGIVAVAVGAFILTRPDSPRP